MSKYNECRTCRKWRDAWKAADLENARQHKALTVRINDLDVSLVEAHKAIADLQNQVELLEQTAIRTGEAVVSVSQSCDARAEARVAASQVVEKAPDVV